MMMMMSWMGRPESGFPRISSRLFYRTLVIVYGKHLWYKCKLMFLFLSVLKYMCLCFKSCVLLKCFTHEFKKAFNLTTSIEVYIKNVYESVCYFCL